MSAATAAKGRFPYPHRNCAEWMQGCSKCRAQTAAVCFIKDCPWLPAQIASRSQRLHASGT